MSSPRPSRIPSGLNRPRVRRERRRAFALAVESLEERVMLSQWIGGAHLNAEQTLGDPNAWSNPLNWLGGAVPGPGDTASFSENVSFSLPDQNPANPPSTYSHPFNNQPNLDSSTTVEVSVDGSFGGTITVENGVTLTLPAGQSSLASGSYLQLSGSGSLVNQGQFNLGGTIAGAGNLTNSAGSTIDFTSAGEVNGTTFTNAGTIATSTAGTAWITNNTTFGNQSGAINVSAGTLDIDSSGTSGDATFTVAAGAAVDITGNSTWNGNYTGSGAGSVVIDSDEFASINANGATFSFPTGMLTWESGAIFGQFTNLGDLTISGPNPASINLGNTLTNTGTIEVSSQLNLGNIDTGPAGAFLNNEAGGTISLEGSPIIIGAGTINNQGTLDKTGAGTASINVGAFNNLEAPINVSAGSLVDSSGGIKTRRDIHGGFGCGS